MAELSKSPTPSSQLEPRVALLSALRSPSFALLWAGQTFSVFGDGVYLVALAWLILKLTGSAGAMASVLVAASIPRLIFLLLGGVLADRLPRRLIMLWADVGRGIAVGAIALLSQWHVLQMWHLIALGAFFGLAQAFFIPAYSALVPLVVPHATLKSANSLTMLSRTLGGLLGPGLGAALVATVGIPPALGFDALTFFVSALTLMFVSAKILRSTKSEQKGARQTFTDLREGFSYIASSAWLWVTIVLAAFGNVLRSPYLVSLPRLVSERYPQHMCFSASLSGGLHLDGVCLFGSVDAGFATGGILATLLVGMLHRIPRRGLIAYIALAISSLAMLSFAVPWNTLVGPWILVTAAIIDGASIMTFELIWVNVLQELVPAEKLGRVSSVDWLGSLALGPVGIAVIGIMTDKVGPALIFAACALLDLGVNAVGFLVRGIRELE